VYDLVTYSVTMTRKTPPAKTDYADEQREIYPNAQLQLVAAELRYPFAPRLGSEDALAVFVPALQDDLPIAEPVHQQTVMFGNEGAPDVKGSFAFRLTTRDRTTAATLSPTSLILETTAYERYGAFRRLLQKLITLLDEYSRPAGVDRVGLRYIDEIRVPDIATLTAQAWKPYIDTALIAPVEVAADALSGMTPRSWNGILHFESAENTTIVLRYGALEGHAVNPSGPLRLKRVSDPGPFFLLDIDSFWSVEEVIADFDATTLLDTCDRLHRPISSLFERCITERLRNDVLRKETIGAT
jgi:uncharacterized protein (TIGR04255 family)